MNLLSNIKGDIYGGITAAVVALPLALAFGVASGLGPLAGLWGAILVGFFASAFGGTPAQVSGPTGPMTVVMASIVMDYAHAPMLAFTVVIMGGVLQILFGILRLGNLISIIPYTVISGFMSGIGCIIIILQLAPLMGQPIPEGGTIGALSTLPTLIQNIGTDALIVGVSALIIMILWPARLNKLFPAPLLALIVGTVAVSLFFNQAPVIGEIPTGFPDIQIPNISFSLLQDMLGSALILALLGTIDSLLTSLIADSMSNTPHNSNKELIGQGIGNAIAGLFGALPGAGATMRTVINIRAGGITPLSGIIHSLALCAIVLGLGPLAEKIPHAVLAGILIKVGWDIIDWEYLKYIKTAPKKGVIHMSLVLILTVFVDLIIAVATGLVVASLSFVKHMSNLQIQGIHRFSKGVDEGWRKHFSETEQNILNELSDEIILYHLEGPMSFGAAKGIFNKLNLGDDAQFVLFDFSSVTYLDTSAAISFRDTIASLTANGKIVLVCNIYTPVQTIFDGLHALDQIQPGHQFQTREAALQALETMLCISGQHGIDT